MQEEREEEHQEEQQAMQKQLQLRQQSCGSSSFRMQRRTKASSHQVPGESWKRHSRLLGLGSCISWWYQPSLRLPSLSSGYMARRSSSSGSCPPCPPCP